MLIKNNATFFFRKKKINLFRYDRSKLIPKWLHIGPGNFHRSHQAFYLHNLLNQNRSNWSILNFDILKNKKNISLCSKLKKQDCLYSLITRKYNNTSNYSLIGCINNFLITSSHNIKLILNNIFKKEICMISLTITENGYFFKNNQFDIKNFLIKKDIYSNECNTIYGFLYIILKTLIKAKHRITVLSCDNILNNSSTLRSGLKSFCVLKNNKIVTKIDRHMTFPNSMVDRITPKFKPKNINIIFKKFGYTDKCVVESEEYSSWIIEDKINTEFPNFHFVGVQFVDDIKSYQNMKMKMLNASHCSTSFLGSLTRFKFVHQTFNNKIFVEFIKKYLDEDVIPSLKKNFYNYSSFKNEILKRFSNKNLLDTVERTTVNGSKNLEIFIKPSLKYCFKKNKNLKRFALIYASWFVFLLKIYKANKLKKLDDENKHSIKKIFEDKDIIESYLKNHEFPHIKNYINDTFKVKLKFYVKLLQSNQVKKALSDAIQ